MYEDLCKRLVLVVLLWSLGVTLCYGRVGPEIATPLSTNNAVFPAISSHFGRHGGYDRLAFAVTQQTPVISRRNGTELRLELVGVNRPIASQLLHSRIVSLSGETGSATLHLLPGSRIRIWRTDSRLVVDVFDGVLADGTSRVFVPAPAAPQAPVFRPPAEQSADMPSAERRNVQGDSLPQLIVPKAGGLQRSGRMEVKSVSGLPSRLLPDAGLPASQGADHLGTQLMQTGDPQAATNANASSKAVSVLLLQDAGLPGPAIFVPVDRNVGAAAFSRGGEQHVVFDSAQLLDLSALKDTIFRGVTEQLLPDGLHLRLHASRTVGLRLFRKENGWIVRILMPPFPAGNLDTITGHFQDGALALKAESPGHVLVLDDDITGGRLFVGTQRSAGQRVVNTHVSGELTLLPTWQGIVVQPNSDRVLVRAAASGFSVSSVGRPLLSTVWPSTGVDKWPDQRVMTRIFDFPDVPSDGLHRLLGQALQDAAALPRPSRYSTRMRVAQAMLSQGLDVEAAAVLRAAAADDPTHPHDALREGLSAVAAWLSAAGGGAPSPSLEFDPTELGSSDEAVLWRALLQPDRPDIARQAAALATAWPVMLGYPSSLQRLMLRPAASLLAAGAQKAALSALLSAFPTPSLDVVRAEELRSKGKVAESLALLDRVAGRPDRLARATALEQAVEIKLATHALSPAQAAEALDTQLYAWRGGDRELRLRLREAELLAQSGSWRQALRKLRETEALFPAAHDRIEAAERAVAVDFLRADRGAKLDPLEFVAFADDASNLLTGMKSDASLAPLLADRLLALDLPSRAEPILRGMFDRTSEVAAKAELGVRLASLVADRGDAAAALGILNVPDESGLDDALVSRRTCLRASLLASLGNVDRALALLADQHSQDAFDLRATLLEGRRDWTGGADALRTAMHQPSFSGRSPASQREAILRLARDESNAGDREALRRLRLAEAGRFGAGQDSELFAVLTAEPVRSSADLQRSAMEIRDMRSLPGSLAGGRPF